MQFLLLSFYSIALLASTILSDAPKSDASLSASNSENFNPTSSNSAEAYSLNRFFSGLTASLYVIIISELGDKTFFIAAIMSMQHSRCLVYSGAMAALAIMTVLSAILGYATTIIPRILTYYSSGILFAIFGLKMLYDAYKMSPSDVQQEFDEVKLQLSQSTTDLERGKMEDPPGRTTLRESLRRFFSPISAEAFVLTFLAEWGDRSQLTTIVLAATKSVSGVIAGGILGHAVCTGLAVLVGRFIAQRIPVKWLTYIGGITFIVFAAATFLGNPSS